MVVERRDFESFMGWMVSSCEGVRMTILETWGIFQSRFSSMLSSTVSYLLSVKQKP